jgi:hypothetical protein
LEVAKAFQGRSVSISQCFPGLQKSSEARHISFFFSKTGWSAVDLYMPGHELNGFHLCKESFLCLVQCFEWPFYPCLASFFNALCTPRCLIDACIRNGSDLIQSSSDIDYSNAATTTVVGAL